MNPRTADNPRLGRPLTIGGVNLSTNLLLAPVAGYCDLAWRVVCRELGGVGLACTDLLSPQGVLRGTAHSLDLAMTNEFDRPLGMQLYGGDGGILAEGALWAVRHGATIIDINMGCPVDKVTKKDGGSKLMCDIGRTVKIAETVVMEVGRATAGRVPVTAKMRLGWSCGELAAPELAVRLARVGIAAVTVHGRYAQQHFKGAACRDGIRAVVEAVRESSAPVPVIGNGDVVCGSDAVRMMRETGCDGVMIGRGSFSRPWIFRDAWAAQRGAVECADNGRANPLPCGRGSMATEPLEAEKLAIIRRYFGLMLEYRDERYALNNMRRRISWLGKALGACKPMKERVRTAADADAVWRALDEFEAGGLRVFEGEREEAEEVGV